MKKSLLFLSVLFAVSCNSGDKTKQLNEITTTTTQQLTGEWSNLMLHVEIHSKDNTDSSELLEVDRAHWEEKLKIKPIRTFFRADSTWNSAHYNLQDSIVYNPSGKWWIKNGKELMMAQQFPSADTTRYLVNISGDTASFEATLDWDMDGKRDDRYFGTQIKAKRDR
jgi:hypothetical protein